MSLQAQSNFNWTSDKNKIKIPFELTHNLIIVDVNFNGIPLKMIADTGSDMNILFSFPEKDSLVLSNTEKIQIKGVGKAFLGFIKATEFMKLITDENENFRRNIFYENVRDFKGEENKVNSDISETIKNQDFKYE